MNAFKRENILYNYPYLQERGKLINKKCSTKPPTALPRSGQNRLKIWRLIPEFTQFNGMEISTVRVHPNLANEPASINSKLHTLLACCGNAQSCLQLGAEPLKLI